MSIAVDPDFYDTKWNWVWSCPSCLFTHTSKGYTCADVDEALKAGVRCPACAGSISEPRKQGAS